jgi:hypothetical protein
MGKLEFSDGEVFNLDTPMHPELRADGWYVVGNNMMQAVESEEEALELIAWLNEGNEIK